MVAPSVMLLAVTDAAIDAHVAAADVAERLTAPSAIAAFGAAQLAGEVAAAKACGADRQAGVRRGTRYCSRVVAVSEIVLPSAVSAKNVPGAFWIIVFGQDLIGAADDRREAPLVQITTSPIR